jgi:hypothetical protein
LGQFFELFVACWYLLHIDFFSLYFWLFLILIVVNSVFQICILIFRWTLFFSCSYFLTIFFIVIRFSFFSLFFSFFDC